MIGGGPPELDGNPPSVRGAPGAFGLSLGSNTSERRPGPSRGAAGGGSDGAACAGGGIDARGRPAPPPRLGIVRRPAQLLLELLVAELQLLDDAGELPDLVLQTIEPHHQLGRRRLGDFRRPLLLASAAGALAAGTLAAAEK